VNISVKCVVWTSFDFSNGGLGQIVAVRIKITPCNRSHREIQISSINKYKRPPLKQYGGEPRAQSKYKIRETVQNRRHYNIKNNM
jgi:hypothetical protein